MKSALRQNRVHGPSLWALTLLIGAGVLLGAQAEADAKKRKRRAPRPVRDGIYLRLALASPGSCIEGTDFCPESASTLDELRPDIALGGRFGLLGVEGRGFSNPFEIRGEDASAGAFVGSLKLFPVRRGNFDPYLSAGVGFMSMSLDRGGDREGFTSHIGAGADVFLGRQVALGLGLDRFFLFPEDSGRGTLEEEGLWTARLNLTVYFGSPKSKRKKARKRRPKKRRRPKRVPKKPRPQF